MIAKKGRVVGIRTRETVLRPAGGKTLVSRGLDCPAARYKEIPAFLGNADRHPDPFDRCMGEVPVIHGIFLYRQPGTGRTPRIEHDLHRFRLLGDPFDKVENE